MNETKPPRTNPNEPLQLKKGLSRPAIVRSVGETASERYLAQLADKSFLNLWSYPNVFIDKRADAGGDGKELCDLLVVCGDDILIFSDKTVGWPDGKDEGLAWKRWFKRAIAKSVDQIRGAERWITTYPDRIFLDRKCTQRLPLPLPPADRRHVHGIAVALGAGKACRKHFEGGSGSLAVRPALKGEAHMSGNDFEPFAIGDVNPDGSYIHVLDDATLDIVLGELDTITDLACYFKKKEELIRSGRLVWADGEEDMVAYYMTHLNAAGEHDFALTNGRSLTAGGRFRIEGGTYGEMRRNQQYLAKKQADRNSYVWDELIKQFTTHMMAGTSVVIEGQSPEISESEEALRYMALVPRYLRRIFGESILEAIQRGQAADRFTRAMLPGPTEADRSTGFFFMTLQVAKWSLGGGYERYRQIRRSMLEAYALAVHEQNPFLDRVVGIATEPPDPRRRTGSSEDLVLMERPVWTDELRASLAERKSVFNIMVQGNYRAVSLEGNEFPSAEEQALREKKESSRRLFREAAGYESQETTPAAITPTIGRFARELKDSAEPVYVPVINDAHGLYGYCSDGVLQKIRHDGGGIRFGWTIWEWPGVLYTAEFHAVWVSPDGALIDITPKPAKERRIVFVPDEAYAADFDFDGRPRNRRMSAVAAPDPKAYVAKRISELKLGQRAYEEQRAAKARMTLEAWLAQKMPADPAVALVDELIAVCNTVDELIDAAPEMGTGFAVADESLLNAHRRKAELIGKARTLR